MFGRAVTAGVVLCLALAACTSKAPQHVVTVTVPPTSATHAAPHPSSKPPPPRPMKKLPGRCSGLLPEYLVYQALGRTVRGDTSFVVGTPDRTIRRIGYLNCRYGVRGTAVPAVEIGVSLYQTPARAAARVTATVHDYEAGHGASGTRVDVRGGPATVLRGGTGAGYNLPTLVLSLGQRTVAVTLSRAAAGADATRHLSALAAVAVKRTG